MLLLILLCGMACSPQRNDELPKAAPQRIISLAPSVTETLFALGLGDRVIAVSDFCTYPPEVAELPRVGDFFNPNLEAIIRLNPDLVILLESSADFYHRLTALKIPALMVRQESVEDILASFTQIGKACGAEEASDRLTESVGQALKEGMIDVPEADRKTVLIAVGHEPGPNGYQNVFIAGRDGYYDRLVWAAGGKNVYDGAVKYPQLSREGILRLNPDIIIDVSPDLEKRGLTKESIMEQWGKTGALRAVTDQRIAVLDQGYVAVPGPRVPLLWRDVKGAVQNP